MTEADMDWDEARRPAQSRIVVGEALDRLSIGDLEQRVMDLQAEIERVRREIETKRAHEARAASIFKS